MEPNEEKKKMGEEQKRMGEEQMKMMEAQKKMMEEQMSMRKKQMEMTLKQLRVNRKLVLKTIDRIKADRDVVENVEMGEEKNETRKKALKAKLAEIDAIVEGEHLKLEMIDFNIENIEKQMASPMPQRGM